MVRKEKEFITSALVPLSHNHNHVITGRDYLELDFSLRDKWFAAIPRTSYSCSNCPEKRLTLLSDDDEVVICDGCLDIKPLRPEDKLLYKFKMEEFLQFIRGQLTISLATAIQKYKSIHLLGTISYKEDEWNVAYGFSHTLVESWGTILEAHFTTGKPATLLVVDKVPSDEEQFIHVLAQCGILLISWDQITKKNLEKISKEHEAQLGLQKTIQSFTIQNKSPMLLASSPLKEAATTAQGDEFEELVVNTCQWLVETILPFGGSYKGFAVPDGLITNTQVENKLPVLFYDCKSFKGDEYVHKASIPMQASYYQGFLQDFWAQGNCENKGFIIFSSSFPDDVQKQITGSPQWNYVQEQCTIFFIGVESLDRANLLLDRYGSMFDHSSFMELLFEENIRDFEDHEVQTLYEKMFPASAYTAFRFIHPDQFEVCLVSALLKAYEDKGVRALEGLASSFKRVLRRSKHANLKKEVTDPTIPPILNDYITAIKKKQTVDFLKPLSLLLLLNRAEEKLRNAVGDDAYDKEISRVTIQLESQGDAPA